MVERGELVERLEKATGPSLELDLHVSRVLLPKQSLYPITPAYTASIDAAIALVERVLPGAYGTIGFGSVSQAVILHDVTRSLPSGVQVTSTDCSGRGSHRHSAIALLIALLKAGETQ